MGIQLMALIQSAAFRESSFQESFEGAKDSGQGRYCIMRHGQGPQAWTLDYKTAIQSPATGLPQVF